MNYTQRDILFECTLLDQTKKYFTSASHYIFHNNQYYIPDGSLSIKHIYMDNFSQKVDLIGTFSKMGILKKEQLEGMKIKISFLEKKLSNKPKIKHLLTCICSQIHSNPLSFLITASSYLENFNHFITKSYTNKCRAKLGDSDCNIDPQSIWDKYKVYDIISTSEVIIAGCNNPSNFYDNGLAYFSYENEHVTQDISFSIKEHKICEINGSGKILHKLNLDTHKKNIESYVSKYKKLEFVFLLPGCDKSVQCCKNTFKNNANYRGEPYLANGN